MSEQFMQLRKEYLLRTLNEDELIKDPIKQFQLWFQEAIDSQIAHPDAMTLATVTAEGSPDARIVLLKEINSEGFYFFTNYLSAKGRQLSINYSAALLFFWPELERQVRIKGNVQKTPNEISDSYFSQRPTGAQLSAIASPQSEVIPNRKWLEDELLRVSDTFRNQEFHRPKNWGGFLLSPHEFEFWQGRENRLHDRIRYRKADQAQWQISRLAS